MFDVLVLTITWRPCRSVPDDVQFTVVKGPTGMCGKLLVQNQFTACCKITAFYSQISCKTLYFIKKNDNRAKSATLLDKHNHAGQFVLCQCTVPNKMTRQYETSCRCAGKHKFHFGYLRLRDQRSSMKYDLDVVHQSEREHRFQRQRDRKRRETRLWTFGGKLQLFVFLLSVFNECIAWLIQAFVGGTWKCFSGAAGLLCSVEWQNEGRLHTGSDPDFCPSNRSDDLWFLRCERDRSIIFFCWVTACFKPPIRTVTYMMLRLDLWSCDGQQQDSRMRHLCVCYVLTRLPQ